MHLVLTKVLSSTFKPNKYIMKTIMANDIIVVKTNATIFCGNNVRI